MKINAQELKDRVRLTGVSLPLGFGVTWEYPEQDKETAARILTFLENRRVLYHPFADQCPGNCISSVIEIRDRIQTHMEATPRQSYLHRLLAMMRKATHKFLDYATAGCKRPASCHDCMVSDTGCLVGLSQFRTDISRCIVALCYAYGLDPEEQMVIALDVESRPDNLNTRPRIFEDEIQKLVQQIELSRSTEKQQHRSFFL